VLFRSDHVTPLYPQKLVLISPTIGGRSVDIVRSRTKATELVSILRVLDENLPFICITTEEKFKFSLHHSCYILVRNISKVDKRVK
jgi:hypothetical protein